MQRFVARAQQTTRKEPQPQVYGEVFVLREDCCADVIGVGANARIRSHQEPAMRNVFEELTDGTWCARQDSSPAASRRRSRGPEGCRGRTTSLMRRGTPGRIRTYDLWLRRNAERKSRRQPETASRLFSISCGNLGQPETASSRLGLSVICQPASQSHTSVWQVATPLRATFERRRPVVSARCPESARPSEICWIFRSRRSRLSDLSHRPCAFRSRN